jgi:hypothetical protein
MAANESDNKPDDFDDLPREEQLEILVSLIEAQLEGTDLRLALEALDLVTAALAKGDTE